MRDPVAVKLEHRIPDLAKPLVRRRDGKRRERHPVNVPGRDGGGLRRRPALPP